MTKRGILRYDGAKIGPLRITQVVSRAADGRLLGDSKDTADPVQWIVGLLDAAKDHPYAEDLAQCLDITLRTGNTRQIAAVSEVDRLRPFASADSLFAAASTRQIHTSRLAMGSLSHAIRDGIFSGRDVYDLRLRTLISLPRMREGLAPVWAFYDLQWTLGHVRTILGNDPTLTPNRLQTTLQRLDAGGRQDLLSGVADVIDAFSEATAQKLREILREGGQDAPEPVVAPAPAPTPVVAARPAPAPAPALPPPTAAPTGPQINLPRPIPASSKQPVFANPTRRGRPRRIVELLPQGTPVPEPHETPIIEETPPVEEEPAVPAEQSADKPLRSKRGLGTKYATRKDSDH
jgi:hypothetical protein